MRGPLSPYFTTRPLVPGQGRRWADTGSETSPETDRIPLGHRTSWVRRAPTTHLHTPPVRLKGVRDVCFDVRTPDPFIASVEEWFL